MTRRPYLAPLILVAVVIVVQLLTSLLGAAYYLTQLTMVAYYALATVGLCMLMGYAGQLSLGQAGFFAIGGYTAASVTTLNLSAYASHPFVHALAGMGLLLTRTSDYGKTVLYPSPWISFIAAVILTVLIALLIGRPILSLRGHYLAMATFGFGIIIYRILLATHFLGEADGISGVPPFTLVPGLSISGDLSARIPNYYIAWGTVLLGMIILTNLIRSRVGRSLRALHGSEEAANAMGVNTSRLKLHVFVLSAVFASVAGVMLTHYNGSIGPSEAGTMKSIRYVAIVAVGGMGNLWGTLTMSAILNFLSLRGVFGSYDDAVFGVVLIVVMLAAPDGFLRLSVARKVRVYLGTLLQRRSSLYAYLVYHRRGGRPENPLRRRQDNGQGRD